MRLNRVEIVSYHLVMNVDEFDLLRYIVNKELEGNICDSLQSNLWSTMNQYNSIDDSTKQEKSND